MKIISDKKLLRLITFLLILCVIPFATACSDSISSSDSSDVSRYLSSNGSESDTNSSDTESEGGNMMSFSETNSSSASEMKSSETSVEKNSSGGNAGTSSKATSNGGENTQKNIPGDLGKGITYYVSSSSGNDSNNGKSSEKPFKTVLPLNRLTLNEGDNVLFKRGDVFEGAHFKPLGSGRASDGNWITIDAYGIGANPVFSGASRQDAAISLSQFVTARGYRIRNLDIRNYLGGIVLIKSGEETAFDGLIIENCSISNITTNKPYGEGSGFPERLDTGYGMYLKHIKNVIIRNLDITSTDIPIRIYAVKTVLDNINVSDSRVTGVMLFGAAEKDSTREHVLATEGGIVLQNSRILYTGISGLGVGTTGILVENTKECIIKNTEVGYTTNGVGDNDGCAVVWEQLNINCTLDGVYAHDNDGPLLLAMEHPENIGSSTGNKVINCISVNNGKRDYTSEGSFLNQSGYSKSNQKIEIGNCIDVGVPGSVPYTYWGSSKVPASGLDTNRLRVSGFISGTMNVYNTFDEGGLDGFAVTNNATVSDGRLSISAGGKVLTSYSGSDYIVSTWLKGKSELLFMTASNGSGYSWAFESGKITAKKVSNGKSSTIKSITVPGLNPSKWFRARVQVSGGKIRTYINDLLVDTLSDGTYKSGSAGVYASGNALVDEFFVYRYAGSPRTVRTFEIPAAAPGGFLSSGSSGGWNTKEQNWLAGSGITSVFNRPFGTAHAIINSKNAYLQYKSVNVNVNNYKTVNVLVVNATSSRNMYVDFTTDGGSTWHTKKFTVGAMTSENILPFKALWPAYKNYAVDMSDVPEWSGTVNGIRIRTGADSGFINLKQVVITE